MLGNSISNIYWRCLRLETDRQVHCVRSYDIISGGAEWDDDDGGPQGHTHNLYRQVSETKW